MAETLSYVPTRNISGGATPRVRRTSFGDGYVQRVGDGLNIQPEKWILEYVKKYSTIQTILGFFTVTEGVDYFWWTPPTSGAPLRFVYTSYEVAPLDNSYWKLTVNIEEVFDLT